MGDAAQQSEAQRMVIGLSNVLTEKADAKKAIEAYKHIPSLMKEASRSSQIAQHATKRYHAIRRDRNFYRDQYNDALEANDMMRKGQMLMIPVAGALGAATTYMYLNAPEHSKKRASEAAYGLYESAVNSAHKSYETLEGVVESAKNAYDNFELPDASETVGAVFDKFEAPAIPNVSEMVGGAFDEFDMPTLPNVGGTVQSAFDMDQHYETLKDVVHSAQSGYGHLDSVLPGATDMVGAAFDHVKSAPGLALESVQNMIPSEAKMQSTLDYYSNAIVGDMGEAVDDPEEDYESEEEEGEEMLALDAPDEVNTPETVLETVPETAPVMTAPAYAPASAPAREPSYQEEEDEVMGEIGKETAHVPTPAPATQEVEEYTPPPTFSRIADTVGGYATSMYATAAGMYQYTSESLASAFQSDDSSVHTGVDMPEFVNITKEEHLPNQKIDKVRTKTYRSNARGTGRYAPYSGINYSSIDFQPSVNSLMHPHGDLRQMVRFAGAPTKSRLKRVRKKGGKKPRKSYKKKKKTEDDKKKKKK